MRRTSYPTSGYSLGTRSTRSSRRLLVPKKRRNPLIRPALLLLLFLVLGSRALAFAPAHHSAPVAARASTSPAAAHRAAAPPVARTARPLPTATPAPTPTPSATPTPIPTALPTVAVPTITGNWLLKHPITETPPIAARAAIVVDLTAGQILYQQSATTHYAEASLTKLMTAMVAVDLAPVDRQITVTDAATQVEPNHMGLSAGEQLTLGELLDGLLLDSGNDAAEAIASGIVDRAGFINFMNQKAAALKLKGTHFTNPSGLDEPGHFTTASDLAIVAATLLTDYPALRSIVASKQVTIGATPQHKAFNPINIDRLLWTYSGAIGLKPGYTGDAGYCLAAAATRNGRTIIAVVLGSTQHFTDGALLLDFGFRHPVTR